MEAEWDISAPSAGHTERLRAQRLLLSRSLATSVERTMALSGWKGAYPIGQAVWVNSDKNPVLGGPLNLVANSSAIGNSSTINTGNNAVAGVGGGAQQQQQRGFHNSGAGSAPGPSSSGAGGGVVVGSAASASSSALALSQQTVVSALQNGTVILYNTVNTSKSTLFVPSDVRTTSGGPIGAGGNFYGTRVTSSSSGNTSQASTAAAAAAAAVSTVTVAPVEHTIASTLAYGSLTAVALSPLSYRSDNASKMAMSWIFQDAVAVCQLDTSKRDPNVEAVCKLAPIPQGLLASNALLRFSNLFEWGLSSASASSAVNSNASNTDEASLSPSPPPRTRFLASVICEAETSTSRLMISVQTSTVPTDVVSAPTLLNQSAGGSVGQAAAGTQTGISAAAGSSSSSSTAANLFAMKPIAVGGAVPSSTTTTWGTIFGEIIFMEWLANPKPSHLVRRAALLAERDVAPQAGGGGGSGSGSGGGYYRDRRNYYGNHGGGRNRRGYYGGGNDDDNDGYYNRGGGRHGGGGGGGGGVRRSYEDYLPTGLQPEGGSPLLLLGTSDCRLLLVQVYVTASPLPTQTTNNSTAANSTNAFVNKSSSVPSSGASNPSPSTLAWRVISETLIATDCPTQHMAAFNHNRPNYSDAATVLGLYNSMNVSVQTATTGGAVGSALTAASITTSVTTELMVSFVSMGNVLQNALLEVTWPLQVLPPPIVSTASTPSSANMSTVVGQKREREEDESLLSSSSSLTKTIPSSALGSSYPVQHLLQLQPLTALSSDDFYIQTLTAGVFDRLPVFIIALSTGAIVTLDGRSLAPLHIFQFERSKHSSLTHPLALAPREHPVMIAVVDDENLTVIKQHR